MLKVVQKILILTAMIGILAACSSKTRQLSDAEAEQMIGQVYLVGNKPNLTETVSELIDKSGVRKGGYIVIIPTSLLADNPRAKQLKKKFFGQQIMAVHILKFNPNSAIKKTDILAVENATIICILGEKNNQFIKLANKSQLKAAIQNANENGALVAGLGKSVSFFGEYYYHQMKDVKSKDDELKLKPGLGILKNTVVDENSFFEDYRKQIQTESSEQKITFISLPPQGTIWIKKGIAVAQSDAGIVFISPDKTLTKPTKGEEFKLWSE